MADITVVWDAPNSRGNWKIVNGDLLTGSDLYTAVLVSLFSDRIAEPGDVLPDNTGDKRGWWGDIQDDGTLDPIGSRLWLIYRSEHTDQTLKLAVSYAQQALRWMIDDGVAANIDVQGNWNKSNFLALQVQVYKVDGTVLSVNADVYWSQI